MRDVVALFRFLLPPVFLICAFGFASGAPVGPVDLGLPAMPPVPPVPARSRRGA